MLRKLGISALLLMFCISFASGAAAEEKTDAFYTGDLEGYTIMPAKNSGGDSGQKYIYDTIMQGETNWHTKNVNSYVTVLNVDLNWGDSSDSLRLGIYTPDWQYLGEFYDSADGKVNGRINIDISNPAGIAQGTWHYEVYGYSVFETEDYYL